jgi:plasmid replication initiation protein
METKLKPVVYNSNHYVVMANDIIKSSHDMTLQEARLIRLVITQVVKEDKDFKTYSIKIKDLAEYLGITGETIYRDIKEICRKLRTRLIDVGKEGFDFISWTSNAKYDTKTSSVIIKLSDEIKPYILELEKWFTQYKFKEILSMHSYYALRLYELLRCYDGAAKYESSCHEISITTLRFYFACEKKYAKISHFKDKIIDTAIKEINEKTDIFVNVSYTKTGREVASALFSVRANYKNIKERKNE